MQSLNPIAKDKIIPTAILGLLSAMSAVFLAGLPWFWIILLISIIPIAMLAVYVGDLRKFSFYLFVFLLPVVFQKVLFNPASELHLAKPVLVLSISDIPLMVFCFMTILKTARFRIKFEKYFNLIALFLLAWIAWGLLSVLNVLETHLGIYFVLIMLVYLVKAWILFICVAAFPFNNKEMKIIAGVFIVSVLIQGVIILIQHFSGYHIGIIGITPSDLLFRTSAQTQYSRATGTVGHANGEAIYLSFFIPVVLSIFMMSRKFSIILFSGITLILGFLGLILTFSRGGWISTLFACAACIFFILKKGMDSNKLIKLFLIFIFSILAFVAYGIPMLDRITVGDEGATIFRWRAMDVAIKMVLQHPFIGTGLNNFQEFATDYGLTNAVGGFYKNGIFYFFKPPVHNRFILTAAETGIVGLILFLAIIISVLIMGYKCVKRVNPNNAAIAIGLFSAFLGSLVFMQVEIFSDTVVLTMLMLVIGMLYNCYILDSKKHL